MTRSSLTVSLNDTKRVEEIVSIGLVSFGLEVVLEQFWKRMGYLKKEDLSVQYPWKDIDQDVESNKKLTFCLLSIFLISTAFGKGQFIKIKKDSPKIPAWLKIKIVHNEGNLYYVSININKRKGSAILLFCLLSFYSPFIQSIFLKCGSSNQR